MVIVHFKDQTLLCSKCFERKPLATCPSFPIFDHTSLFTFKDVTVLINIKNIFGSRQNTRIMFAMVQSFQWVLDALSSELKWLEHEADHYLHQIWIWNAKALSVHSLCLCGTGSDIDELHKDKSRIPFNGSRMQMSNSIWRMEWPSERT